MRPIGQPFKGLQARVWYRGCFRPGQAVAYAAKRRCFWRWRSRNEEFLFPVTSLYFLRCWGGRTNEYQLLAECWTAGIQDARTHSARFTDRVGARARSTRAIEHYLCSRRKTTLGSNATTRFCPNRKFCPHAEIWTCEGKEGPDPLEQL